MVRFVGVGVAAALAMPVAAGCGGPYKGPAEKLPKVKKGKEPPDTTAAAAPVEIKYDEDCTGKFTDDPAKAKKSAAKASPFIGQGNDSLARAASNPDPAVQVSSIVAAIEQYKKALLEDNYNAEATYQLAVAYAQVRKKGCAIKLLKRLAELGTNPRLAGGQGRLDTWLDQVEDEPAFKPFKNDAMGAIGR